jgi:hypothetical protein
VSSCHARLVAQAVNKACGPYFNEVVDAYEAKHNVVVDLARKMARDRDIALQAAIARNMRRT